MALWNDGALYGEHMENEETHLSRMWQENQELNDLDGRRVRPRLRNDYVVEFEHSADGNWVDADYAKMLLRNVTELRAKVAALRAVIDTLAENNAKKLLLSQQYGKFGKPASSQQEG